MIRRRLLAVPAILVSSVVGLAGLAVAQDTAKAPAADNTKVNKRDRKKAEPTADQGKNNKSDLKIQQEIRRAVVADKSLSTYAHNVKIVSQGGQVTLKGTVHTDAEKSAIQEKAAGVAGAGNVTNNILVKGDATSDTPAVTHKRSKKKIEKM